MSTDRELLEAAARAAGMETLWEQHRGAKNGWLRARVPGSGDAFPVWNPLTNDGEALRLAVKLEIHVQIGPLHAWASTPKDHAIEHMTGDPYAATRRAIVRAAAAIGEKM